MKLKKFYPVMSGCCIGTACVLLAPANVFIAIAAALLLGAGVLLIIYSYK